jgi:hypothetical protein
MHTIYNHYSDSELADIIDSTMWTAGIMQLIPLLQEASNRLAKNNTSIDNTPQLNLFK